MEKLLSKISKAFKSFNANTIRDEPSKKAISRTQALHLCNLLKDYYKREIRKELLNR